MIAGTLGNLYVQLGGGRWAIGYDAGESLRIRRDLGYNRATPRDEEGFVGKDGTRELIRLKCSDLRRNMPVIAGACDRIGLFGAPLRPQWFTDDEIWNTDAEQFIADWGKTCDARGRQSLDELQRMALSLRPTHGGYYIQTLDDGTIRPIEPERIRQPTNPETAKQYVDGVKIDRETGRTLGYWVHARDADGAFSAKHDEGFIPAESMIAVTRPNWRPDQVREIGDLAPAVPALQDLHEANKYTLNTMKSQSEIVAFHAKAGGAGSNSGPRGSTPSVGQRQTIKTEWGQIVNGSAGDTFGMLASPTPGATHIPYMRMQLGLASTVLQFPYEFFTLDLTSLDWSRMRGMLTIVNAVMRADYWPWLGGRMMTPLILWRVAMAMREGGELAPAPIRRKTMPSGAEFEVSQWSRFDLYPPEEMWLDRQETAQADTLEMQMTKTTLGQVLKRKQLTVADQTRARCREIKLMDAICQDEGVDPARVHKLQIPGQTEPNANPKRTEKRDKEDDADASTGKR